MRYLRWSRAGKATASPRQWVIAVAAATTAMLAAGCTPSAEGAVVDEVPTTSPTSLPTTAPTSTPTPTSTATPTPASTPTPTPTPAPSGTALYGPLLIEGAYDWPTEMPNDLTDEELFAINIFASTQNADFAALAAQSDLSEFDPVRPYIVDILVEAAQRSIDELRNEGVIDRLMRPTTEFVSIRRVDGTEDVLRLLTCEHYDIENTLSNGSTTDERGTGERVISFERTEDNHSVRFIGWSVDQGVIGELVECGR